MHLLHISLDKYKNIFNMSFLTTFVIYLSFYLLLWHSSQFLVHKIFLQIPCGSFLVWHYFCWLLFINENLHLLIYSVPLTGLYTILDVMYTRVHIYILSLSSKAVGMNDNFGLPPCHLTISQLSLKSIIANTQPLLSPFSVSFCLRESVSLCCSHWLGTQSITQAHALTSVSQVLELQEWVIIMILTLTFFNQHTFSDETNNVK